MKARWLRRLPFWTLFGIQTCINLKLLVCRTCFPQFLTLSCESAGMLPTRAVCHSGLIGEACVHWLCRQEYFEGTFGLIEGQWLRGVYFCLGHYPFVNGLNEQISARGVSLVPDEICFCKIARRMKKLVDKFNQLRPSGQIYEYAVVTNY